MKKVNNKVDNGYTEVDAGLSNFPANFVYSGNYNYNKPGGCNTYGRYWSATPSNNNNAYRLGFSPSSVTPIGTWNKWDAFAVRCIVK